MKKRPVLTAVMLAALTALGPAVGVWAAGPVLGPVREPVIQPVAGSVITAEGTVVRVTNLESPHYEVGGWALMLDDRALLARLEGKHVQITGKEFTGLSILMRRQLEVTSLTATLEGVLTELTDLETPHFEVDGFVVQGEAAALSAMKGEAVRITGNVVLGSSLFMKPVVQVQALVALQPGVGESLPAAVEIRGVLQFEQELEGPHYAVDGWVVKLEGAEVLAELVGKYVTIKGTEFDGISIFMRPQVVVQELQVTLRGNLQTVTDLEGSHFELGGFVLVGENTALQALSGQEVQVTATLITGPSIYMRPALEVAAVQAAGNLVPKQVLIGGKEPRFPTAAVMRDGHLMLPLRATIEAAGGLVEWDPVAWAVRVSVGRRSTTVAIGRAEHAGGKLAVAPFLQGGYTLASADLYESLGLGLYWEGTTLHILTIAEGGRADR